MPMQAQEIKNYIKTAIPDAEITLTDLAGDGDHWQAEVVSSAFKGLSRVKQHQLVNAAFGEKMGRELHALALKTSAPQE